MLDTGRIERVFRTRGKIIAEGLVYHVTQRAPGKEVLFVEDADYRHFKELLVECSFRFEYEVYAYVLMRNHVHILLRTHKSNLNSALANVFQRYAFYFNKKYERKGHVFSGAFRCSVCNSERYCLAVSLYIHLNPVKAGIVHDACLYAWSSCEEFLRDGNDGFVKKSFILNLVSDDSMRSKRRYQEMLQACAKASLRVYVETPQEQEKIFVKIFSKIKKFFISEKPPQGGEELIALIHDFQQRKRISSPQEYQSCRYVVEQLKSRGYTYNDIAELLGVSRQKIYRLCNKSFIEGNVAEGNVA